MSCRSFCEQVRRAEGVTHKKIRVPPISIKALNPKAARTAGFHACSSVALAKKQGSVAGEAFGLIATILYLSVLTLNPTHHSVPTRSKHGAVQLISV